MPNTYPDKDRLDRNVGELLDAMSACNPDRIEIALSRLPVDGNISPDQFSRIGVALGVLAVKIKSDHAESSHLAVAADGVGKFIDCAELNLGKSPLSIEAKVADTVFALKQNPINGEEIKNALESIRHLANSDLTEDQALAMQEAHALFSVNCAELKRRVDAIVTDLAPTQSQLENRKETRSLFRHIDFSG